MNPFLATSVNPFDLKAALLAGHAQHPVIIHFPIALFIASAVFEALAIWRRQPVLASVAYYNLLGAAMTVPLAIATGLGAWRWQLQGAVLKGNLRLHLICALTSALLIFILWWMRACLRANGVLVGVVCFAVALWAIMIIMCFGSLC